MLQCFQIHSSFPLCNTPHSISHQIGTPPVEGRDEGAWPRRASRAYLIGRRSGKGCRTLEEQGMGYGTQPHDWELGELESMKTLPLPLWGAHLWEASCDLIHRRRSP